MLFRSILLLNADGQNILKELVSLVILLFLEEYLH